MRAHLGCTRQEARFVSVIYITILDSTLPQCDVIGQTTRLLRHSSVIKKIVTTKLYATESQIKNSM